MKIILFKARAIRGSSCTAASREVADNPDLIIRQIRDELVELVPDTYLGQILFKLSGGRLTNIGYFALKRPAG